MKNLFILAFVLVFGQAVKAQVSEVSYKLKYNQDNCLFDCYLVIEEGNALTTRDRAQFNSQISFVAPLETMVTVVESYMPIRDNQRLDGNVPTTWDIINIVDAPDALPESKVFSITPSIMPAAFYNELNEGDEVKLFSMSVSPMSDCASGFRLYKNESDPRSDADGMHRADFTNAFTMGGVEQKYDGKYEVIMPAAPVIDKVYFDEIEEKVQVSISQNDASFCQEGLVMEFFKDGRMIGDYKDVYAMKASDFASGEYKLVVSDALGCQSEATFTVGEQVATGTNDLNANFTSSIYPNPAHENVNLIVNGQRGSEIDVKISDINGSSILKSFGKFELTGAEQEINLPTGLTSGVYTLIVTNDNNEQITHKLFIVK